MNLLIAALMVAFFAPSPAQAAKEVFAHVIVRPACLPLLPSSASLNYHTDTQSPQPQVGNLPEFTLSDWESDIKLAQASQITAFVLNIAAQDPSNTRSLDLAFEAANALDFSLFFSFDYAAQGAWPQQIVIELIQKYAANKSYFKHDGTRPFVSTFEGPGSAEDWRAIKQETNAFFVPDWSSVAAPEAANLAGGVADGLFSFDAWPNGDANMTTEPDKVFLDALRPQQKVYMMAVSPWFFTNLPGFGKNWLWRGDELW
jgi:hypothetical protein